MSLLFMMYMHINETILRLLDRNTQESRKNRSDDWKFHMSASMEPSDDDSTSKYSGSPNNWKKDKRTKARLLLDESDELV